MLLSPFYSELWNKTYMGFIASVIWKDRGLFFLCWEGVQRLQKGGFPYSHKYTVRPLVTTATCTGSITSYLSTSLSHVALG